MQSFVMSELSLVGLRPDALVSKRRAYSRDLQGRYVSAEKSFAWLLKYPLVSDWIDAYTSEETREKKLYQLEKILHAGGFDEPSELLRLSERDLKLLTRRVANWYLQRGKGVWAKQIIITMKGFMEANDKKLEFKRAERIRSPVRKKVINEYIPNKMDVFRMADNAGSIRNRTVLLCLFQAGVRVSCLCNWTFGLVQNQLYPEIKVPIRVKVTPAMDTKLNLYGLSYYVTGVQREAAESLRDYLDMRMRGGWIAQSSDPIFMTERTGGPVARLRREGVWLIVKNVARRSGIKPESIWVHCFRKSFRKVLNATPQIDEDTKEALMGHKLPGARGNYFDFHDEDEVMMKYMRANFGRNALVADSDTGADLASHKH
jgi:integrase